MFRKVKFLLKSFVFQNVLSLKFKDGKFYDSPTLSMMNLLMPFVTYICGFFINTLGCTNETVILESAISPFVMFIMHLTFIMKPAITGVVSIMLYKKRFLMRKLLMKCFQACLFLYINIEDLEKNCLYLYLILQSLIVIQWIILYFTYYRVSLMSALILFLAAWNANLSLFFVLLGVFFLKFIVKLLDECLKILDCDPNCSNLENRLLLMSSLLKTFNKTFGNKFTFVFSTVIFDWVTCVSI